MKEADVGVPEMDNRENFCEIKNPFFFLLFPKPKERRGHFFTVSNQTPPRLKENEKRKKEKETTPRRTDSYFCFLLKSTGKLRDLA
jgi:hypothetical protein